MESIIRLQTYLDEMKESMPENVYLQLCNQTKRTYEETKKEKEEKLYKYTVRYCVPEIHVRYDGHQYVDFPEKTTTFICTESVFIQRGIFNLIEIPKTVNMEINLYNKRCAYTIDTIIVEIVKNIVNE